MLIDCFTFFNELEMLECRLNYLDKKVDKFILVEAYTTHTGIPKTLYFDNNKNKFEKYLHKIIHVAINIKENIDYTFDPSKGENNACWKSENNQRNGILQGLQNIPDDAIIMISDLDEIPNIDAIDRAIRLLQSKQYVAMITKQFYYNLRQCLIEPWPATVLTTCKIVKLVTPQKLRQGRGGITGIQNGGWHLTYFGGVEAIKTKIKSFTHQEFNNEKFTNSEYIKKCIENGDELYQRPFPMIKIDSDFFPEHFRHHFKRYL